MPTGGSLTLAQSLAADIARYPLHCMLADRRSVLSQQGLSLEDALHEEYRNSISMLRAEGVEGARRFAAGLGRHGDFEDI